MTIFTDYTQTGQPAAVAAGQHFAGPTPATHRKLPRLKATQ
jgi:hypothetical protein